MLPAEISGKIKVLAWPATSEPGAFSLPTVGDTAASNWNSPSTGKSRFSAFSLSQALRILSTAGPEPEPRVE